MSIAPSRLSGRSFSSQDPAPAAGPATPVSPPTAPDDGPEPGEGGAIREQRALVGLPTIVAAVLMGLIGVMGLVVAAGGPASAPAVSDADQVATLALRQHLADARSDLESMPAGADAARGLVLARSDAASVADLQTSYHAVAGTVAAHGGTATASDGVAIRRDLMPYFDQNAGTLLGPWYLSAADARNPKGPATVSWSPAPVLSVASDGTVPVHWTATGPRGTVLAWADADFDITRQAFTGLRVHTTAAGAAARLGGRS